MSGWIGQSDYVFSCEAWMDADRAAREIGTVAEWFERWIDAAVEKIGEIERPRPLLRPCSHCGGTLGRPAHKRACPDYEI